MIVAMAVVTTMAMPPMLRWGLSRVPMSEAERQRLEREDMDARGFVSGIERLLLAVDDSPNGRFASRLAGLVAGARGLPITVLPFSLSGEGTPADRHAGEPSDKHPAKHVVAAAASDSQRSQPQSEQPDAIDVTVRKPDAPVGEAVAEEARKGYDLLLVGIEHTRGKGGTFHRDVARIASGFEGPLAIVAAKGRHLDRPDDSGLDILVPVNGTEVARRGAEVAIMIARGASALLRVLQVAQAIGPDGRDQKRGMRARRREQAVLKDIATLASRQGLDIAEALHAEGAADAAILSQAGRRNVLIVMGVARRRGEPLFFGDTAGSVFEKTPASILLVST
jgi:nucleotide-binding universal stress UspA family protein